MSTAEITITEIIRGIRYSMERISAISGKGNRIVGNSGTNLRVFMPNGNRVNHLVRGRDLARGGGASDPKSLATRHLANPGGPKAGFRAPVRSAPARGPNLILMTGATPARPRDAPH